MDAVESLIETLRSGLCHSTNVANYRAIVASGAIHINDGSLSFSHENSHRSNCFCMKAISLFDFETPTYPDIFASINRMRWESVLLRHQPSVIFNLRRTELPCALIHYDEAKRRCGLGGIIPHFEVCHPGPIQLAAVFQTLVVSQPDTKSSVTDFTVRRYDSFLIPEEDLK
jgi:hypothetical protein